MLPPLSERIALATLHVEKGRRIVDKQRDLVEAKGPNLAEAKNLLALFETSQAIFESDLDRLSQEQKEAEGRGKGVHGRSGRPDAKR
jgi:hypothetical protein